MSELHICTTGELFSFRPSGAGMEDRDAIFSAFRYGSGPGAVLITYGIQGKGYFKGIQEHFDEVMDDVRCVMGYVWVRHVPIYRRALRKKATVEEMWRDHPYGLGGPEMAWIKVEKLTERGQQWDAKKSSRV